MTLTLMVINAGDTAALGVTISRDACEVGPMPAFFIIKKSRASGGIPVEIGAFSRLRT